MYMFFNIAKVVMYNTILISDSSLKVIVYKGLVSGIYAIIINLLILKYTCIFDYLNKKLIINFKEKDKSLYSK